MMIGLAISREPEVAAGVRGKENQAHDYVRLRKAHHCCGTKSAQYFTSLEV